jgi:thiol:disulfide interchange protein DsbD
MVWVRKLFGILLVGVAVYFLVPQAKQVPDQEGFFLGVLGIFGGLLLGFLEQGEGYSRPFKAFRAAFGVLLIVSGALMTNAAIKPEAPGIFWLNHTDRSVEDLQEEEKPVFVYFYADWCPTCRELDGRTFRAKNIVETSKHFNMLKVNCTTPERKSQALLRKYEVSGLPTLVLLDSKEERTPTLKIVGFVGPEELERIMHQYVNGAE